MEPVELLRRIPPFIELDRATIAELVARSYRRQFPAGEVLFHQGDPAGTVYVILSGHVNLQVATVSGGVSHIGRRGPRQTLGEVSVIEGKRRLADAITTDRCDLLILDARDFQRCMERFPKFERQVMRGLAARIREIVGRRAKESDGDALERVSALILELMEDYGTVPEGDGKRINIQLTQQQMAERIGVKRECVNRKLSSLQRTGAIRVDGRQVIVMSEERLRRAQGAPEGRL